MKRYMMSVFLGLGLGIGSAFFQACSSTSTKSAHIQNDFTQLEDDQPAYAHLPNRYSSAGPGKGPGGAHVRFQWPVDSARLTQGFHAKPLKKRGRSHWGIDLAAPKGTPILSSHEGTVIYVGRDFHGFGKLIMVEEPSRQWATLYAHLSKTIVKAGDNVVQGQRIGEMGRTGRATGVHLHFEIRHQSGPVDPLFYLPDGTALLKILDEKRHGRIYVPPSSNAKSSDGEGNDDEGSD